MQAIPQEFINQYASNGGDLEILTKAQRRAIPEEISKASEEGMEALVLYSAGKIKKEDLPANVFLNCFLRKSLLAISKTKLRLQYNQLCKEQGYTDCVPKEVQEKFNEKQQKMYKEINDMKKDLLEQYNKKINRRK